MLHRSIFGFSIPANAFLHKYLIDYSKQYLQILSPFLRLDVAGYEINTLLLTKTLKKKVRKKVKKKCVPAKPLFSSMNNHLSEVLGVKAKKLPSDLRPL